MDLKVVSKVRERYLGVPLMVDANSAYHLSDLPLLKQIDAFDLLMIEQPLAHDDIMYHAKLQKELQTPICLDESILSVENARKALELESCRIINIKVSRLSGLLEENESTTYVTGRGFLFGAEVCTNIASDVPQILLSPAYLVLAYLVMYLEPLRDSSWKPC